MLVLMATVHVCRDVFVFDAGGRGSRESDGRHRGPEVYLRGRSKAHGSSASVVDLGVRRCVFGTFGFADFSSVDTYMLHHVCKCMILSECNVKGCGSI